MIYGLLVYGSNHFIVDGPCPTPELARALVRQWAHPMPLRPADTCLAPWSIRTKAFREQLAWAVVIPCQEPHSPAVLQLLDELQARGLTVHTAI
ncbi:MAG: hypothetical protein JNK48_33650 [Bryobacterales bacterium]|nr:hypothetical protein [Bryobacterales bacterium]